ARTGLRSRGGRTAGTRGVHESRRAVTCAERRVRSRSRRRAAWACAGVAPGTRVRASRRLLAAAARDARVSCSDRARGERSARNPPRAPRTRPRGRARVCLAEPGFRAATGVDGRRAAPGGENRAEAYRAAAAGFLAVFAVLAACFRLSDVCAPNFFVNRSTRPSVSISFCRPVKNGWQFEQISRCSSFLV